MNNPQRKVIALDDGEGRETKTPSEFQSLGELAEQITRRVTQTRLRNDNQPGWDAADNALPVKKEGS